MAGDIPGQPAKRNC